MHNRATSRFTGIQKARRKTGQYRLSNADTRRFIHARKLSPWLIDTYCCRLRLPKCEIAAHSWIRRRNRRAGTLALSSGGANDRLNSPAGITNDAACPPAMSGIWKKTCALAELSGFAAATVGGNRLTDVVYCTRGGAGIVEVTLTFGERPLPLSTSD
uniref:Uncharacterized protein n=1 Tax=Romanomermis culicivorax TaxID=13658 RepID=A0A915I349_ROMCU